MGTSNSYTSAPAPAPTPISNPAKLVPNYFNSDKQATSGTAAEKLSKSSEELSSSNEKISKAENTPAPASTCSTEDLNSTEKQPSASPVVDEPKPAPSWKGFGKEPGMAVPEQVEKPVPATTLHFIAAEPIPTAPATAIPVAAPDVPTPTPGSISAPAPAPAPKPTPAPKPEPEPNLPLKKEPEVQKLPKAHVNGEAPAAKTPVTKTPEPSTSKSQEEDDQPKAKKPLSNLAEKNAFKIKD